MTKCAAHIVLVQDTLARISARSHEAASAFEGNLRRYAPTRSHFARHSCDALVPTILAGLSGDCRAEVAQARLGALSHELRDAGYGPRDYIAIHAALLDMVAEHVQAIPGAEEAWADVIGTILASMVAEAHGPRRSAMPLAA